MSEYQKIHIVDDIIENESSPDRALEVSVYVDTLGAVIVELADSMTIRTDWKGAIALSEMLRDAVATLDELDDLYNRLNNERVAREEELRYAAGRPWEHN